MKDFEKLGKESKKEVIRFSKAIMKRAEKNFGSVQARSRNNRVKKG